MTSARKIKANRANAQASTGPKSARGKARAALNARRHGLSTPVLADAARSAEVESLAHEIAGQKANSEIIERARQVAEAQIDLLRVRQARQRILAREMSDPEYRPYEYMAAIKKAGKYLSRFIRLYGPDMPLPPGVAEALMDTFNDKPRGSNKFVYILSDLTRQLIAMDRYERRARSRRKFAIRAFDLARRELVES